MQKDTENGFKNFLTHTLSVIAKAHQLKKTTRRFFLHNKKVPIKKAHNKFLILNFLKLQLYLQCSDV